MDPSISHLDVKYFINDFFDRVQIAYQNKSKHLVRNDLNFFCEIAHKLNSPNLIGESLSNYTQMMQTDSNWDSIYYQSNKSFQSIGIISWFTSSSEKYEIFKIIKKMLDPISIIFISKEDFEKLRSILNSTHFAYVVFAYLINKVLLQIYLVWKSSDKMDQHIISNKYDEILNKHCIQSNLSNKPNFNNIFDKSVFEANNLYKIMLYSQVSSDNYNCFFELFNYLKSYYDIIAPNNLQEHIIPEKVVKKENNLVSEHKSTKRTTKKENIIVSEQATNQTDIVTKTKKKPIPPILKRNVWNKYIGEEIGKAKCVCCKLVDITQLSFHCGHVIAEVKGGELKMDNLRPICQSCNSSMGTTNMDEYIRKYGF